MNIKSIYYLALMFTIIFLIPSCSSDDFIPNNDDREELVELISNKITEEINLIGEENWDYDWVPMMNTGTRKCTDTTISNGDTLLSFIIIPDSTKSYEYAKRNSSINFYAKEGKVAHLWTSNLFRQDFSNIVNSIDQINNQTFDYLRSNEIIEDTLWIKDNSFTVDRPNYCLIYQEGELNEVVYHSALLN